MGKYKLKNSKNNKEVINNKKELTDDEKTIKSFIIISLVIILIIVAVYFVSKVIVNKNDNSNENTNTIVEIDYSIASVGMILNRPYDEYYVMVYDKTNPNAALYSSLITGYKGDKKVYFCDLNNDLNKKFISTTKEGNPNATKTEEFSFGDITLLYIKNNKVNKYLNDIELITKTLQ